MTTVRHTDDDAVHSISRVDAGTGAPAGNRMSTRWGWQKSYVNTLFVTDALVVVLAVALAHVVRFGQDSLVTMDGVGTLSYTLISVALGVAWIAFLSLFRTRSRRLIGAGFEEYQRVVSATLNLFGLVAIVALIFRMELARGYLAIALPVGLAGLLFFRWVWRRAVARRRR